MNERMRKLSFKSGHVPGRANWLAEKVLENGWTTGAELGVQGGRTFVHLLESCPNLTLIGVDTWTCRKLRQSEINVSEALNRIPPNQYYYDLDFYSAGKGRSRAVMDRNFTNDAVHNYPDKYFDFVFIDADHTYEGVKNDIENWMPKLKDTGYICGHDINYPAIKKAVDEKFTDHGVPYYELGPDNCWGLFLKWKQEII